MQQQLLGNMLQFIHKNIYLAIALGAILWSVFSSVDRTVQQKTKFFFAAEDTSLKTRKINEIRLKQLHRYELKTGRKNRQSGMGTAFYVGNDMWLTARHVVNECKRILIKETSKKFLIEKVLVHPNSDLALFKYSSTRKPKKFNIAPNVRQSSFATGFPGGRPGDAALAFTGYMAMEERGYNILEKHSIFAVLKKYPKTLLSFGGMSGGPSYDRFGNLNGVIVAEFTRRGLLGAVSTEQISWLIAAALKNAYFVTNGGKITENHLITTVSLNSFAKVGQKLRDEGTVNHLFCEA